MTFKQFIDNMSFYENLSQNRIMELQNLYHSPQIYMMMSGLSGSLSLKVQLIRDCFGSYSLPSFYSDDLIVLNGYTRSIEFVDMNMSLTVCDSFSSWSINSPTHLDYITFDINAMNTTYYRNGNIIPFDILHEMGYGDLPKNSCEWTEEIYSTLKLILE